MISDLLLVFMLTFVIMLGGGLGIFVVVGIATLISDIYNAYLARKLDE